MKLKENFIVRNVLDEYMLMPTGSKISEFNGSVILNDVSAFILGKMKEQISKDELIEAILGEYDVSREQAETDLDNLIAKLADLSIIEL